MNIRIPCLSLLLLLITACATGPEFDTDRFHQQDTPQQVVGDIGNYRGSHVLWGGILINSENLEHGTQLEVLAYPLLSNQKPDPNQEPIGRFLAFYDQYLESVDYSGGRFVSIAGILTDINSGWVGEAEYIYPVINVKQIHLWPKSVGQLEPRVHVGFGFVLSN